MTKKNRLDKIRGCLVGGAAGDALGYPVEFTDYVEITDEYGDSGITEYRLYFGEARISDDTQMTLFTAVGIMAADTMVYTRGISGRPSLYMPYAYKDWMRTQYNSYEVYRHRPRSARSISWLLDVPELYVMRAPGNTCMSAILEWEERDSYVERPVNNSKGCGAIMRIAPLALYYDDMDLESLDMEAAEISAITHGHSLGYMPAAVLTHILWQIAYGDMSLIDAIHDAQRAVTKIFAGDEHLEEMNNLIDTAIELSGNELSDIENIRILGEGWVAEETLAIAIYCSLRYEHDFSAGIIAAVNHDGDSDSTGAVTGNILGLICGFDAIDSKWKDNLELMGVILEVSDDITSGYIPSRDWESKYVDRKWPKTDK